AATGALAQSRREVPKPRDLDLEARLARLGVAVKDLEDHRGAIEDVGAGRLLEVALLRRRQVVIDEHDLSLAGGRRATIGRGGVRVGFVLLDVVRLVRLVVVRAGLLARARLLVRGHLAAPTGPPREL